MTIAILPAAHSATTTTALATKAPAAATNPLEDLRHYWDISAAWVNSHWLQIGIAVGAGLLIYFLLSMVRTFALKHAQSAEGELAVRWQEVPRSLADGTVVHLRRPEIGMVITDVERMDADRVGFEIFRRREFIPVDGWVLPHVLRNPALAPASAMLRREVFAATGGFDTTLRTAEDLDFHLRVAARFQIAVIAEPLTRAMRGHQGLSALARTNRDYLDAIERFVDTHAAQIAPPDRAAALFWAYLRNVRGALTVGTLSDAARLTVQAARFARTPAEARELARTGALVSKNAVVRVRRALGGR